ncbi:hypothetical protein [Anabaena azotica]|uniref:Uncharacterized protein n=1 Tax=Anabaena azotica FACHB-119 TaxID=947527 RepID=A0ABR8DEX3_9NOST|nr:hypothetical protein [Anabaena azotica]MBD2505189.1 hypothetical protein [Anabaena azotica FACHB-119]
MRLDELGVKLNSTLIKAITESIEETIQLAIKALKEQKSLRQVKNPAEFLVDTIKNTLQPNTNYEQRTKMNTFNE